MNLLLEKRGYFTKIWFIWFLPACTAQSANASSIIWFTRPVELYIHVLDVFEGGLQEFLLLLLCGYCVWTRNGGSWEVGRKLRSDLLFHSEIKSRFDWLSHRLRGR